MHRFLIGLLFAAAVAFVAALPSPSLAEGRVTQDQVEKLQDRVKAQRDAYVRFGEAEEEASKENMPDRAATFHDAKTKAYAAFTALNEELRKLLEAKQKQDRADLADTPLR